MHDVLLWFWTGAIVAVVLWWVVMLLVVGFVGPVELARMARGLNRSSDDQQLSIDPPKSPENKGF